MSIFKCKMCGGDIQLAEDKTFGTCEYCGCTMTFPKVSDEQRAAAFNRGNYFRRIGEFDKALAVYERIVAEDEADAEAHWCCALCRFGIEYVEDPATFEWLPTCHRASFDSFLEDVDYLAALEHSEGITRRQYQKDAAKIAEVQRGILATSRNTEPYDVFISYKELDADGSRTRDSILAQEVYYRLTERGWRVFFSRISLEDVPGTQYEPYIFAALNSAKVMIVVGTSAENLNAVWVKNEWSRYLALIKNGARKTLIPAYKDMDPYDLPEEFSHLMAQDMSKLGFMQDLIRGIRKIVNADAPKTTVKETVVVNAGNVNTAPLLKRAFMFLEDGEWDRADDFCEQVLNQDPENARAYLGKLMAEKRARRQEDLKDSAEPFDTSNNYQKVIRFADPALADTLRGYIKHINERNENDRLEGVYGNALRAMSSATSESAYRSASGLFKSIPGYKDSDSLSEECLEKAEECRKNEVYDSARALMAGEKTEDYESAIKVFRTIYGWKDSEHKIYECQKKIEEIRLNEEKARIEAERKAEERRIEEERAKQKTKKILSVAIPVVILALIALIIVTKVIIPNNLYDQAVSLMEAGNYDEAISSFEAMNGYKDSEEQIKVCQTAIKDKAYSAAAALLEAGQYDEAITAFTALSDYKDSEAQLEKCYFGKYGNIKNINIGESFKFGSYEQDNKTSNGKEEIEWIVLDKDGMSLLLISEYALDCRQYNTSDTSVTWETCSLRKWLNGTFFSNAFSSDEQNMISTTTLTANYNPSYNTSPGSNTNDKVFLLSITEVYKYFKSDDARKCVPTAYAIANGAYTSSNYTVGGRATCWWWLRSPGRDSDSAAYVSGGGSVLSNGNYVDCDYDGVRPALWIDLGS